VLAITTFAVDLVIMVGYTALAARVLRVMKDPGAPALDETAAWADSSSPPASRWPVSAGPRQAA
jgi:hypothetical protein